MPVSAAQVRAKAQAFVDALGRLPPRRYAATPSGHYGRDLNTLRELAREAFPGVDERLFGRAVRVCRGQDGSEFCDAGFVEIETYARQILEQATVALEQPGSLPPKPASAASGPAITEKAYDVAAIRRQYNQAYEPWSPEDDAYLEARFLEGATIDDLVWEFGRQPGGIRSRLRKLGLDPRGCRGQSQGSPQIPPVAPGGEPAVPAWREQRPRAGCPWTPEEDEQLLREFKAGTPLEAIAQSLGRGVFSLEVRLSKLGCAPRDPNP